MLKRLGIAAVMAAVLAGGLYMGGSSFLVSPAYAGGTGAWRLTGPLKTPGGGSTATRLADGRVLVAGEGSAEISAEIYDPASGTWTTTGSLNIGRGGYTATRLADGRVLVAGGLWWAPPDESILDSAELYDPVTGTWTATAPLNISREDHTATRLADGRVLVAGGNRWDGGTYVVLSSAELYDPGTRTWTPTGSLNTGRDYGHTATLLTDGRVLVAGGYGYTGYLNSVEIYDPASGTWTTTASLHTLRTEHTATLLAGGRVLVAGGQEDTGVMNSTELYDPATGTWTPTGSIHTGRISPATLLADGRVLMAGGRDSTTTLKSAIIYDPATALWTTAAPLHIARDGAVTRLADGRVLAAGGMDNSGVLLNSAEIYDPAIGQHPPLSALILLLGD